MLDNNTIEVVKQGDFIMVQAYNNGLVQCVVNPHNGIIAYGGKLSYKNEAGHKLSHEARRKILLKKYSTRKILVDLIQ